MMTGFEHTMEELRELVSELALCVERLHALAAKLPKGQYYQSHYLMLRKVLGVAPWNAVTMSNEELREIWEKCDPRQVCQEMGLSLSGRCYSPQRLFALFAAELVDQGAQGKVDDLRAMLSNRIRAETKFDTLRNQSEWHAVAFDDIRAR